VQTLLMERWDLAQDGEGQVVLLSGEPSIGKSRILSELHGLAAMVNFHRIDGLVPMERPYAQ
jgi:predicted ATPase